MTVSTIKRLVGSKIMARRRRATLLSAFAGLAALGPAPAMAAEVHFSYGRINPSEKKAVIRDSLNRPCVTLRGELIRHFTPIDVTDQNLRAENACGKTIKVKACLVGGTRCAEFLLRAREKKQIVFGVTGSNAAEQPLRFDFIEHEAF